MKHPFFRLPIALLSVLVFLSCAQPLIKEDREFVIGINNSFDESLNDAYEIDHTQLYRVMPGDVLELLYNFHRSSDKPYVFERRDVIAVKFIKTPELNEQQQVRPDGKITLPYIGEVDVAGYTPKKIEQYLKDQYSKYLKETELYVVVVEYGGEVNLLKESIRNNIRGQSKLVTVRSDGNISLPLVGEVRAVGKTIPEMNRIANVRYQQLTTDLQIDLLLHQAEGSRICVLGEVRNPGYYQINGPVNVLQAIGIGGGFTDNAERSSVLTIRNTVGKISYKLIDVDRTIASNPQGLLTMMSANDIVYIPKTTLSNTAKVATDIASIIFFRGWGFSFGYDVNQVEFR